jgi:hypothetical protein
MESAQNCAGQQTCERHGRDGGELLDRADDGADPAGRAVVRANAIIATPQVIKASQKICAG